MEGCSSYWEFGHFIIFNSTKSCVLWLNRFGFIECETLASTWCKKPRFQHVWNSNRIIEFLQIQTSNPVTTTCSSSVAYFAQTCCLHVSQCNKCIFKTNVSSSTVFLEHESEEIGNPSSSWLYLMLSRDTGLKPESGFPLLSLYELWCSQCV